MAPDRSRSRSRAPSRTSRAQSSRPSRCRECAGTVALPSQVAHVACGKFGEPDLQQPRHFATACRAQVLPRWCCPNPGTRLTSPRSAASSGVALARGASSMSRSGANSACARVSALNTSRDGARISARPRHSSSGPPEPSLCCEVHSLHLPPSRRAASHRSAGAGRSSVRPRRSRYGLTILERLPVALERYSTR